MKTFFKVGIVSMIMLTAIGVALMIPVQKSGSNTASDFMAANNLVMVEVQHTDGTTEYRYTHNVFTDIGKNSTIYAFATGGAITNGAKYLELSTDSGTPVSGTAVCPNVVTGSGLDIAAGTVTLGAGCAGLPCAIGNASISKQWTASGTQSNIQTVCLGNSSSSAASGSLMAYAKFTPAVNMGSGDQLTVTYYPDFNATG